MPGITKFVKNNLVSLGFVLPNLAISGFTNWLLNVQLHWTGWYSFLAWMIGAGAGFEIGVLLAMLTRSNFKIGKWKYNYSLNKQDEKTVI